MLHVFVVWIQVVNHYVGVGLVAGCKDNDLKVPGQFCQQLFGIGPNIQRRNHSETARKSYWKFDLVGFAQLFMAMYKGLI